MEPNRVFGNSENHRIWEWFGADIRISSRGCGWSSVYASLQRQKPFEAKFEPIEDSLMVLHRSGSVGVELRSGGYAFSHNIPKGSIFFLPAGCTCEVDLRGPLDTLHIYLRSELFNGIRARELLPMLVENDPILHHLADTIELALCEQIAKSAYFIDPIARALAIRIGAISGRSQPWQVHVAGLSELQLRRLRDFVDTNLEQEIRLDSMATACGLRTRPFVQAFKASTGKSPYQYVIAARIERAKRLIEERESLAEIALRCGFSHQEHLTRVFRKMTDQTPGQYRRHLKGSSADVQPIGNAARNFMSTRMPFDRRELHSVYDKSAVANEASSDSLGWSSAFCSLQREQPFKGRFEANADALLVTAPRGGPVDVTYRIGGRVISRHLQEGGIFFLPPQHECEVELYTPLNTIHVYLRSELFCRSHNPSQRSDFGLVPQLGDPEPITSSLVAVLEQMLRERDSDPDASLLADSVSHAIVNRLTVLGGHDPEATLSHNVQCQLSSRNICSVREFIEANIAGRIRLEDLAAICGVSPGYLIRMFRTSLGISPYRYVVGLRINHAKRLLTNPSNSLAEIARQCGFSNQSHFANVFRRIVGETPASFRRSMS